MTTPTQPPGTDGTLERFGVDSEYGRLRDVLLCAPEHYEWIVWNPEDEVRFAAAGGFDRARAILEHGELVAALGGAGVTCHFMEPDPSLPYQVFTRDSSSMTPWGPVLGQIAFEVRRGEYAPAAAFYQRNGVPLWHMPSAGTLEGADAMVAWPGFAIVAFNGVRTSQRAAAQLAGRFEAEGWEVLLLPFTTQFIHIDMLLSVVAEKAAVVAVDIAPAPLLELLARRGVEVIPVSLAETNAVGANLLALGDDRVVSPADNAAVNERLRASGFDVLEVEYSTFTTEGGSVHCSTMPLLRDPA